ncbi:uncharacterized protein BO96DRAFT_335498 [Aspergillus niger CBS 101883]|uniref:Contig An01c0390, genomic contig n=2 Tax=Aspergillus niger TaxID=5061 RepID=A2QAT4_ASPNC|nr:uncharacterized protein BO96DRAFT_335498 [Aspergillus niger CBS 101883]XP_059599801.1 uncharacterized protein An01g12680 [Aspergillus niger]PYH57368.1 hypothetical protein BO96DRAFT_335498 [Aspergillus niger CBS 101883]CAK37318.1 unnamed protein product [Aspergillus niger]
MQAAGDIGESGREGVKGLEEGGEWKAGEQKAKDSKHAHPCTRTPTVTHGGEEYLQISAEAQGGMRILNRREATKEQPWIGGGRSRVRSIGLDHRIRKGKSDPGSASPFGQRRGGKREGGWNRGQRKEGKKQSNPAFKVVAAAVLTPWHLCCESGCGRVPTWVQDASGMVRNAPGYRSGAFRASLAPSGSRAPPATMVHGFPSTSGQLRGSLRATRPTSVCPLSGTDPRVDARCTRHVWMVLPGGAPGPTCYMLYPQGIILDT